MYDFLTAVRFQSFCMISSQNVTRLANPPIGKNLKILNLAPGKVVTCSKFPSGRTSGGDHGYFTVTRFIITLVFIAADIHTFVEGAGGILIMRDKVLP